MKCSLPEGEEGENGYRKIEWMREMDRQRKMDELGVVGLG